MNLQVHRIVIFYLNIFLHGNFFAFIGGGEGVVIHSIQKKFRKSQFFLCQAMFLLFQFPEHSLDFLRIKNYVCSKHLRNARCFHKESPVIDLSTLKIETAPNL
jgi:hypothetical protein